MPKSSGVSNCLVLDTFALISLLYEEPGYETLLPYLTRAQAGKLTLLLNEINLGELYYRIWKDQDKETAEIGLTTVTQLPLNYVAVDQEFILSAASWKAQYPISYADAFVVETAHRYNCPLVSGDPEFTSIPDHKIILLTAKKHI